MKIRNYIYLATLVLSLAISACSTSTSTSTQEETTAAIDIDSILTNGDAMMGKTLTIEGFCTHTCRHGGKKMFLMGSDNSQMLRVEAGKDWERGFAGNCIKNWVRVTGELFETRMDEAYLQNWEKQMAEQAAKTPTGEEEEHCDTESKAQQEVGDTYQEKVANYRKRIAERKEKEGKEYLSFYYFVADEYNVINNEE